MSEKLIDLLTRGPVLPVVTVETPDVAVPLADALAAGGIATIEITLRTPAALEAIRAIRKARPDFVVGAGTVLDAAQFETCARIGAAFAVSPGATTHLLDAAADGPVPLLPGAATASEVMVLRERGYTAMKLFPAEPAGGVALLKALAAPLPEARFCPTGGITAVSAPTYLALPNVLCVGGSWLAPADTLAAGDWPRITALAREAAALAPLGA